MAGNGRPTRPTRVCRIPPAKPPLSTSPLSSIRTRRRPGIRQAGRLSDPRPSTGSHDGRTHLRTSTPCQRRRRNKKKTRTCSPCILTSTTSVTLSTYRRTITPSLSTVIPRKLLSRHVEQRMYSAFECRDQGIVCEQNCMSMF